jgi:N-formylglutamate amidohydrolase
LPALGTLLATAWILVASCEGDSSSPPAPASIVVGGNNQEGVAGMALPGEVAAEIRDATDAPMSGVSVRFTVSSGGGAVTDTTLVTGADGRAVVNWFLGPDPTAAQTIRASAGTLAASLSATATAPVRGVTYLGRNAYIEYIPGDLPIVVSAPHGGLLEPGEIPNRSRGETVRDRETEELAREIADALETRTGARPHVVICRLRRTKLDANREVVEAAQGNRLAQRAWFEYHSFIEAARHAVAAEHGSGFYIDLHGHGHTIPRLELGYLLDGATLRLSDPALDHSPYEDQTSIRALSRRSTSTFVGILRGPTSLGTMLESAGFPAVPSESQPAPAVGDPYFTGGYSTERHGSWAGGEISGVQIETNFAGVRDTEANRLNFATALAAVLESYLATHAGIDVTPAAVR